MRMRHRSRSWILLANTLLGCCLFVLAITMPMLEVKLYVRPGQLPTRLLPQENAQDGKQRPWWGPFLEGFAEGSGVLEGTRDVWQTDRSIIAIISELLRHNHLLVAFVIGPLPTSVSPAAK